MENLISVQIETKEGINVVSSRVVAEQLGKRHDHVLRDLEKILKDGVSPNLGGPSIIENYYTNEQNKQKYREYLLTKNGFTLYMFNIQGYNDFKIAYINAFNEMEQALKAMQPKLPNFNNPAEAARAWATEYEAKQQALLEAKKAQEHVKMLVHNGKTYTSSEIAKELGMKSAIALNHLLEEKHVQYKQNGTWLLYSEHCEKGLTSVKQIQLDNGTIQYDRRWTGKGRDFILNLLGDLK